MKKITVSLYFLLVLTLITSTSTSSLLSSSDNSKPQWKRFLQRYCASISIGALTGVPIDIIMEYFLKKIITDKKKEAQVLINFFIGPLIKLAILKNIEKDMGKDNIPHKNFLMFLTAFLTPFRGLLKNGYSHLFESDFCKWLLALTKINPMSAPIKIIRAIS